jgi:hypothetical protein
MHAHTHACANLHATQGANLIPSHIIHTNVTADMLTDTLKYALDSNMNMYEPVKRTHVCV